MSASLGLTLFIGGLALFLYGAQVLTDSFRRRFGGRAKRALARLTSHRPGAFLFGILLAGGTQSSSVATSLAVGLVDAGLLSLADALTAMMGASLGAMGVTFLLGMDWTFFSPLFLACCVAGAKLPEGRIRTSAENLLGLSILLTGMALLRAGIQPLSEGALLRGSIVSVSESPLLVLLVAAGFTALLQSSNAVVAVSIALGASGLLPPGMVFPLVLGAHVGAAAPVLLVSLGTRRQNARRLAWANLLYRVSGAAAAGLAWGGLHLGGRLAGASPTMAPSFALGFIVCLNALLFYPFAGLFARAVEKLPIRERESLSEPLYLDDSALALPLVALQLLAREMARLAGYADELLTRVLLAPEPKARVEALRRDLPVLAESCLDFMFEIPAPPEEDPARTTYAGVSYALIAMKSLVAVAALRLGPLCMEGDCETLRSRLAESDWENPIRRLVRLVGFSLGSFVLGDSDLSRRALDLADSFGKETEGLRAKLLEGGGLFDSRSEVAAWEFLSAADDLVRAASEIARSESVAGTFR
ncbi:MAG: Na/Pi cotransporter family protein [Synergistales bacterium]